MASEYFMGIDDGGYDGRTFTICVMRFVPRGQTVCEYLKSTKDRDFFVREIDRLTNWHKIQQKNILREIK